MAVNDKAEEIQRRFTTASSYGDTTREEILETRKRRKRQLNVMLMDARRKLADHSAGEKILTEEQKSQLEDTVDLFQRKVESMEVELEEWVSDHESDRYFRKPAAEPRRFPFNLPTFVRNSGDLPP
eukprot:jgi/Psemu1/66097/estExt_Genemark1.C_1800052